MSCSCSCLHVLLLPAHPQVNILVVQGHESVPRGHLCVAAPQLRVFVGPYTLLPALHGHPCIKEVVCRYARSFAPLLSTLPQLDTLHLLDWIPPEDPALLAEQLRDIAACGKLRQLVLSSSLSAVGAVQLVRQVAASLAAGPAGKSLEVVDITGLCGTTCPDLWTTRCDDVVLLRDLAPLFRGMPALRQLFVTVCDPDATCIWLDEVEDLLSQQGFALLPGTAAAAVAGGLTAAAGSQQVPQLQRAVQAFGQCGWNSSGRQPMRTWAGSVRRKAFAAHSAGSVKLVLYVPPGLQQATVAADAQLWQQSPPLLLDGLLLLWWLASWIMRAAWICVPALWALLLVLGSLACTVHGCGWLTAVSGVSPVQPAALSDVGVLQVVVSLFACVEHWCHPAWLNLGVAEHWDRLSTCLISCATDLKDTMTVRHAWRDSDWHTYVTMLQQDVCTCVLLWKVSAWGSFVTVKWPLLFNGSMLLLYVMGLLLMAYSATLPAARTAMPLRSMCCQLVWALLLGSGLHILLTGELLCWLLSALSYSGASSRVHIAVQLYWLCTKCGLPMCIAQPIGVVRGWLEHGEDPDAVAIRTALYPTYCKLVGAWLSCCIVYTTVLQAAWCICSVVIPTPRACWAAVLCMSAAWRGLRAWCRRAPQAAWRARRNAARMVVRMVVLVVLHHCTTCFSVRSQCSDLWTWLLCMPHCWGCWSVWMHQGAPCQSISRWQHTVAHQVGAVVAVVMAGQCCMLMLDHLPLQAAQKHSGLAGLEVDSVISIICFSF